LEKVAGEGKKWGWRLLSMGEAGRRQRKLPARAVFDDTSGREV
jgi:hypothetical protein